MGEYARAEHLLTRPFSAFASSESTQDPDISMRDGSPEVDTTGLTPATSSAAFGFGVQSQAESALNYPQVKGDFVTPHHPSTYAGAGRTSANPIYDTGTFSFPKRPNGMEGYDHDPFLSSAPTISKAKQSGLMLPPPPGVQQHGLRFPPSKGMGTAEFEELDGDIPFSLPILGDEVLVPVVEGDKANVEDGANIVRLVDRNIMCRYLAAQCQVCSLELT